MRRRLLPALCLLLLPATVQAYKLQGYRWFPADMPVPWTLNPDADEPGLPGTGERDEVRAGFEAWERLEDSAISFVDAGLASVSCAGDTVFKYDGTNLLSFADPCQELQEWVLGMTITWYRPSDTMVTNGATFCRILESDIVFSGRHPFTDHVTAHVGCPEAFDLRGVATHEIGHLFGLGHSMLPQATMYPSMGVCDPSKATPDSDDRAAVSFLYPEPGLTYSVHSAWVIDPAYGLEKIFPLPLWHPGVDLPWRDQDVVRDTSRPLMLYQVVPLPHLYAVKQGYDVVLLSAPAPAMRID